LCEPVALAHLSIELGHLPAAEFAAGMDRIRRHFQTLAPWVSAALNSQVIVGRQPRISTCFLIDDYSARFSSPAMVIAEIQQAAVEAGLEIDYLARASGCIEANGVPVADLVQERIVPDPPPNTNGSRPLLSESGWLCNGQRSLVPATVEAMDIVPHWQPPGENGADGQQVFLDVQVWEDSGERRTWSYPFIAATWQLLRLGLLRNSGRVIAAPQIWEGSATEDWDMLPAVIQLNPTAAPFCAYRTLAVLPTGYVRAAHAVRVILGQVAVEETVAQFVRDSSGVEGLSLPADIVDRLGYVFVD
jgi:hypothetical protein